MFYTNNFMQVKKTFNIMFYTNNFTHVQKASTSSFILLLLKLLHFTRSLPDWRLLASWGTN